MSDTLQTIQHLQFSDRSAAEAMLLRFLRETLTLDVVGVELRPLAVSLNSFNGFMTLGDGRRLFFKTHTESHTIIHEYYRGELLANAGYPVLQPVYRSSETGKQLLVYEVIDDPSVFDLAWAIEGGTVDLLPALTQAQTAADDHLLALYHATLEAPDPAADTDAAPVHQLFFHRLQGGRMAQFYGLPGETSNALELPGGSVGMETVRRARWQINGQHYGETLTDIIDRASALLHPSQPAPTIIGHGDAHNGNVFFRHTEGSAPSLLYFDPAFAGRHHPLLDLTKPLFHNVFAMWMYFPQVKAAQTQISLTRAGDVWRVEHDYALPPVRLMFLQSKVERVLLPILQELKRRDWLLPEWRAYLKAALFCCPFLTMNLADPAKFPPEISLLGLVMSVEMGAESSGERSLIDRMLDEVEQAL